MIGRGPLCCVRLLARADGGGGAQGRLVMDVIKQYPGPVQRKVKVKVPAKHSPQLSPTESRRSRTGARRWSWLSVPSSRSTSVRALRAPTPAFDSSARPRHDRRPRQQGNSKGFWTTLAVWNRWRHETYRDDPAGEKQFLDELPAAAAHRQRPLTSRARSRRSWQ